jgi:hypothetical protein
MLIGLKATDPATFTAVAVVFFLIAAKACWLPARRSANLELTMALREEGQVSGVQPEHHWSSRRNLANGPLLGCSDKLLIAVEKQGRGSYRAKPCGSWTISAETGPVGMNQASRP